MTNGEEVVSLQLTQHERRLDRMEGDVEATKRRQVAADEQRVSDLREVQFVRDEVKEAREDARERDQRLRDDLERRDRDLWGELKALRTREDARAEQDKSDREYRDAERRGNMQWRMMLLATVAVSLIGTLANIVLVVSK